MNAENVELEEKIELTGDEENGELESNNKLENDEEFKNAVYTQMQKIHNEGLIVGFQTACHTALTKIYTFESSHGKKSANDYKRCIKDLKKFFETGISRKANSVKKPEEEENVEVETVQN